LLRLSRLRRILRGRGTGLFLGLVMSDRTPGGGAEHGVVAGDVTR